MSGFTSRRPTTSAHVRGRAGGGLDSSAGWAVSEGAAKAGKAGELATAKVLDAHASASAVVLHDLMIPNARYTANIDHVVVVGRTIHLIDSKLWKPGFLWTVGGKTRRGLEAFPAGDKKTMHLATTSMQDYLRGCSVRFAGIDALVVVWPSRREGKVSTWAMRMPGARVIPASALEGFASRTMRGRAPADPAIVAALAELLVDAGGGRPGSAARRFMRRG